MWCIWLKLSTMDPGQNKAMHTAAQPGQLSPRRGTPEILPPLSSNHGWRARPALLGFGWSRAGPHSGRELLSHPAGTAENHATEKRGGPTLPHKKQPRSGN